MNSTKLNTKKIVAGAIGLAMVFSFALPSQAATIEELTAQISSLLATIASLQIQLSAMQGGTTTGGYVFSTNLTIGSTGNDVVELQKILVAKGYLVMPSGVAMGYFGALTKSAVAKWQAAEGISPAAGYVGPISRAKLNSMGGVVVVPPGTPPGVTPPAGATLAVAAGTQPAQQLAPGGAARIPFTKFTVTAGSSDVTVNSVMVTRVGPGQDGAFAGVVLLDENGTQIGLTKTLNSNHQANIGEPFTVKAGTTRTLTVGGNLVALATIASTYAGEVPAFQVTSINTSVPVVGSLPITGTGQVLNGTLTIGTATMTEVYDPGDGLDKSIGTTGYLFGTIKAAASNEDLRLRSIRWNQSGSASAADLANIVTIVDGVSYPTVLSTDGKYYTTTFGSGIVIAKGFSKEISIKGDIVGGPGRTVAFDLYRTTDIFVSGETYGYGITPSTAGASGVFGTTNPWLDAASVDVIAGTVTTIGKATEVASQNIAVNVPNQVLGGFATEFIGEPVTIAGMTVRLGYSSNDATTRLLTNVTIVDQNGAVVAGPKDAADVDGAVQEVVFTDSVTFPLGRQIYTLKGTIDPDVTNGQTLTASTTPSGWTTPTGQNTGNSVTVSQGVFSMNSMTVRTADLNITMSTQPVSQNIVAGGQDVLFAQPQLDASQSGEDIRLSQLPLRLTSAGGAAVTDLTGCQLFDEASVLNTGSNVPTTLDGTDIFSFDAPLTIPKGVVKTLSLKCDVATAGTGNHIWSVNSGDTFNATGVTSGSAVTEDVTTGSAGTMSISTGSLAVSVHSSSPSYTIAAGGSAGVTAGVLNLLATNESINLTKLGLKLTNAASSSPTDLISVSIYDGGTLVGTAVFTGANTSATSTLDVMVNLPKDTDKTLTVKANISDIGSSQPGTEGHLIAIDPENAEGNGLASGTTIQSGATAGVAGVRLFNTFPTLAQDTLGSTGLADGRLIRFKVTANSSGPVGIYQFSFKVATTSATVTNTGLYAYTDSAYSQPISGQGTSGQIGTTQDPSAQQTNTTFEIAAATSQVTIPAGATYYFELRGSVAGVTTGSSVVTTFEGDSSYPAGHTLLTSCNAGVGVGSVVCNSTSGNGIASSSLSAFVASTTAIDADTNDSFIWTPNATTTVGFTANDWTNGYSILGLPSSGIIQTRSN